MQKTFEIGQIVNHFGVKGMVKVKPFTDDITRFDKLQKVEIQKKEYEIEEVKYHKDMVLLKFRGIDTVEQAEMLRNQYLVIKREQAIPLEENSYYIADLLGLKVYDKEDNLLGVLEDIFNTGSNDIYVVRNEMGKQLLLPAIADVIQEINLEEEKIIVHLLNGLE